MILRLSVCLLILSALFTIMHKMVDRTVDARMCANYQAECKYERNKPH